MAFKINWFYSNTVCVNLGIFFISSNIDSCRTDTPLVPSVATILHLSFTAVKVGMWQMRGCEHTAAARTLHARLSPLVHTYFTPSSYRLNTGVIDYSHMQRKSKNWFFVCKKYETDGNILSTGVLLWNGIQIF